MKNLATTSMGKQCSRLALAASFLLAAQAQAVTLSGNFGLVNDYLFRGISQTNEGMALQGGLTLSNDAGFYLSSWGSNISFGNGSMELDLLAGWAGKINEDWTADVGIMQYRYPNGDNSVDQFNFVEAYSKLTYQGLTLGLAYSSDYFGTGVDQYFYYSADYTYAINDVLSLLVHAGMNQFEDNAEYTTFLAAGPVSGSSYLDWSVGVGATVLGSSLQLKYADTDIGSSAACDLCDGRLVVSLTKTF